MKTLDDLKIIREKNRNQINIRREHNGYRILVGMDICGIAAGARFVMASFIEEIQTKNIENVIITQIECIGMCTLEPIVEVIQPDGQKFTYIKMTADKAKEVILNHIIEGKPVLEYTIGNNN